MGVALASIKPLTKRFGFITWCLSYFFTTHPYMRGVATEKVLLCIYLREGDFIIFHRSLLSFIISHSHYQHSSIWVSSTLLNRAAQAQEFLSRSVTVMRGHNINVCRYVTACFQLVRSAYVTLPTSPWDFFETKVGR